MIAGSGPNRKANFMSLPVARDRQWRDPARYSVPPALWTLSLSSDAIRFLGWVAAGLEGLAEATWEANFAEIAEELAAAGFLARSGDEYELNVAAWGALWAR